MEVRGFRYFPISIYSIILGLSGVAIALLRFEAIFNLHLNFGYYLLLFTTFLFFTFTLLHLLRTIFYFQEVKHDFLHSTRINFFAAFTISFILLSIGYLEINFLLAKTLWTIGVILHTIISFTTINYFIRQKHFEVHHYNPAWFIPIVGNLVVPIAGVAFYNKDLSWGYFSVGLIFSIIFMTIFFYRIFFHKPLAEKLIPTNFILLSPPSIGMIAYVKLVGEFDNFAKILYSFALFIVILFLFQIKMFLGIKFYLSWWAYLFPTAAFTIATILVYKETGYDILRYAVYTSLGFIVLILGYILWCTIKLTFNKKLCLKED